MAINGKGIRESALLYLRSNERVHNRKQRGALTHFPILSYVEEEASYR